MDNITPTLNPELNIVFSELVKRVQPILQDDLVGVYPHGSIAMGEFDEHSDADFIIVVREELSAAQVDSLQAMHKQLFRLENPWARRLDGSYFPLKLLGDFATCGQELWYLDNAHDHMVRSPHCNTLVVRWVLRKHSPALVGPPAETLLERVPAEALCAEIRATIHDWGSEILSNPEWYNNQFYQGFIVLSYCRMLHSLDAGIVASKRAGAAWAKAHLDPRWHVLIDTAWEGRPNPDVTSKTPADPERFRETLEFVKDCMERVRL